ncbi:30S ribosomal protein S6 [Candidatus Uhrbacteria bacterium]|nr:30S ribosomal protein S6 [Candidatus Uhrbacteria bacterium]
MQRYELLAILPQHVADTEVAAIASQITEKIRGSQATIVREDHLGRRKLAYKIKASTHGTYELVQFDMESEHVKPLEQSLQLMPEILRFQIVKIPTKSEEQLARERALQEKLARQMAHAARVEVATPEPIAAAAVVPPAPQLSTEELSKKLDELLEKPEI